MWEGLAPDSGVPARTSMTDRPSSGASPLPQGIFSVFRVGVHKLLNFIEAIYV